MTVQEKAAFWWPLVWAVGSGLFNLVIRWGTDAQWLAFCEKRPRLSALVRFVRAAGLDPVFAVHALRGFLGRASAKAAATAPAGAAWVAKLEASLEEPLPVAVDTNPETPVAIRASQPAAEEKQP